jgi:aminoglycoside phosphotransferase
MDLGKRLGAGKVAEVFEYGGDVLKLYRAGDGKSAAFREAATLAYIESTGLPAPMLRAAGSYEQRWGLVMSRAPGEALGDRLMRAGPLTRLDPAIVGLHRQVHAQSGGPLPGLRARLGDRIARAGLPGTLAARLAAGLAAMPDGDRLCHGDFHPWNIIADGARMTIVDWLDASRGAAEADVCRSYVLMHAVAPALAGAYVDDYAAAAGLGRAAILGWLPYVAAARLAENVPDEAAQLSAWAAGLD